MLWNVFPKLWHISHRRVSETPLRAVCPFLKHHTGKLSYPWSITEFRNELVSQWASLVAQTVTNLPAMQETQVQSLGQEESLEKGMATHSSILDWRIPWTEEPGRLQSMGLQRVGHDWAINTHTPCPVNVPLCLAQSLNKRNYYGANLWKDTAFHQGAKNPHITWSLLIGKLLCEVWILCLVLILSQLPVLTRIPDSRS